MECVDAIILCTMALVFIASISYCVKKLICEII